MRLTSLDVYRGLTIAGMILVNMVSIAQPNVYAPLVHATWNGCTFADLVFPFFLFIVGVAMAFSFAKYTDAKIQVAREDNANVAYKNSDDIVLISSTASVQQKWLTPPYGKIFRRASILFTLGLFLNGFWYKKPWIFNFDTLRYMGVLQRISLSYLFASLIVLTLPRKATWVVAGLLLVGYWLAMMYIPVPGFGAGVLDESNPGANLAAFIDRSIIPAAHLDASFKNLGDPEGLFSTIPAIGSVLFGFFTGQWIRTQPVQTRTSIGLALFGIGLSQAKFLWKCLLVSPVALVGSIAFSVSTIAAENPVKSEANQIDAIAQVDSTLGNSSLNQIQQYSGDTAQVTSVSQFSDVQPTDWAFQALQSLVERYGCIAGYPNGTFRGNRAMTRYEFAAGLNACLERVNELIATATANLLTKEDLAIMRRLQEEFSNELATVRGRVDVLEARTAELEAAQFSTTTKLNGEIIICRYTPY